MQHASHRRRQSTTNWRHMRHRSLTSVVSLLADELRDPDDVFIDLRGPETTEPLLVADAPDPRRKERSSPLKRILRLPKYPWRNSLRIAILLGLTLASVCIFFAADSRLMLHARARFLKYVGTHVVPSRTWAYLNPLYSNFNYGADGSVVYTETGESFIYENPFGGTWDADPFSFKARPQADVPSLEEPWDYESIRINGVNLGGWLALEPFITPHIFEPFENDTESAVDEWTLCKKLRDQGRLEQVLEEHYSTFITEKDFADIASAGLNWVRIPLPYWAIEKNEEEPFLFGVSWKYFLKGLEWARKYGLRVNLDLHVVPGSQNGWNHSGKGGSINFLHGTMGIVNAQRTLNIIKSLAQFVAQPHYAKILPMISVVNEAWVDLIGMDQMRAFYLQVYRIIRNATHNIPGEGPIIVIHDGFKGRRIWAGFLEGADRLALDTHPYLAFQQPRIPDLTNEAYMPCASWAGQSNRTALRFGLSITAEWSPALNDCGRYVNGVNLGSRFEGTYVEPHTDHVQYESIGESCDSWIDYESWDPQRIQGIYNLASNYMDQSVHWFFWTWKVLGRLEAIDKPSMVWWSYKKGREIGIIPKDPRTTVGSCNNYADEHGFKRPKNIGNLSLKPYMKGEDPNPQIVPDQIALYEQFPPDRLGSSNVNTARLPTYIKTGERIILPDPIGTGWHDTDDTEPFYAPISDCVYPTGWANTPPGLVDPACVRRERQ